MLYFLAAILHQRPGRPRGSVSALGTESDQKPTGGARSSTPIHSRGQLATLAYNGQWKELLALRHEQPDLANAASTGKG